MAPSALPLIEEVQGKGTTSRNVGTDIDRTIENISSTLHEAIKHIYNNPELAFEEFIAHDTLCSFLEQQGFSVTRRAYGVETAFEVLSGEGGRLISINAEYDALPNVGHACGHHLIAAAGVSAFVGIALTLRNNGIPGRVQLLGTPAEESGGGKVSLLNAGAYQGVDAVLMSHPLPGAMIGSDPTLTGIGATNFLAYERWTVEYFGKPTHASASPWNGINAYDAAVAAHNNIGLLRQQFRPVDRVHGCMLEGPKAANVIGEYTKLTYIARSDTKQAVATLEKRVLACFEAAALATSCEVKITRGVGYADVVNNKTLCERYAELGNAMVGQKIKVMDNREGLGSTDFGNVSHALPGMHSMFAIDCPTGTGCHQHGFQSATGTEESYRRALKTGSLLARTGMDLIVDERLFETVRKEWEQNMKARGKEI
ncbi:related to metal-dependent amidase/aminoacylase/carboxypeptidase [Phialocephala subalpina]|uniref:Peptidase M20 domain-containing protein 2 n=1 Tax=Phialocephala subalpina TaxID=576137 RepID=A0A1L7WKU4_9HELO|nr:related to metal-dependent amidase/aminoacylase/carboxypeptidase [Phialocephala subalpina]